MPDRPRQGELPLTRDDRAAHEVYRRAPPARAREPRDPVYWRGLIVELRGAYPTRRETK